jgi:hypothetical protein
MCLKDLCIVPRSVYREGMDIVGEHLVIGLAEDRDVLLIVEAEEL